MLGDWSGSHADRAPPDGRFPNHALECHWLRKSVNAQPRLSTEVMAVMEGPTAHLSRRALLATLAVGAASGRAWAAAPAADDPWPSLATQIFDGRTIRDGSAVLAIEAPYRAEDAAVVPLSIETLSPANGAERIHRITLVIDQNPSPLAASFTPGANSGMRSLSTRVRVDSYTNIHVVAATTSGQLYAVEKFVKAAGGCSAPAAKQQADSIPLGTMRFRQFSPEAGSNLWQAQLMIRHPNYSGMQMDQISRLYVPAHFIKSVRIWQGDDLLLSIDSGISISENPEFRFDYQPNGATSFRAEAVDSKGKSFQQQWPVTRA